MEHFELLTTKGNLLLVKSNLTIHQVLEMIKFCQPEYIQSYTLIDEDELTESDIDFIFIKK